MAEPVVIVVPLDINRLSPNARMHHLERARRTKVARAAARLAWTRAGEPVIAGPVEVSLLVRRERTIDRVNALLGWKAAEDGLCNRRKNGYGVVEDDSAKFVRYGTVEFETGKRWRGREEVVVFIRPLENIDAG